jgi:hypothetical protein
VSFLYPLLLYIHILSVIMSVGPFFVLIPMIGKLRTAENGARQAYISAFRFAARLAKHAGHVLVVSGVLLAWTGGYPWNTPWIVATVIVLLASLFFLARAFSPHLRRLEDPEGDKEAAIRDLRRSVWIYLALLFIMLWFMVAKPGLWWGS